MVISLCFLQLFSDAHGLLSSPSSFDMIIEKTQFYTVQASDTGCFLAGFRYFFEIIK